MNNQDSIISWVIAGVVAAGILSGAWVLISRSKVSSPVIETMATSTASSTEVAASTTVSTPITSASKETTKPSVMPAAKPVVQPVVSANTPANTPKGALPASPTSDAGGESVSVSDQKAGSTVTVGNIHTNRTVWVAVKDARGWVMGTSWFVANTEKATINLLRPTVAGQTYQVILYADNGQRGFQLHREALILDDAGKPVGSNFKAI